MKSQVTHEQKIEQGMIPVDNIALESKSGIPQGLWFFQGYVFEKTGNKLTCSFRGKAMGYTTGDSIMILALLAQASESIEENYLFPLGNYNPEELEYRVDSNDYPISYADRIKVGNI